MKKNDSVYTVFFCHVVYTRDAALAARVLIIWYLWYYGVLWYLFVAAVLEYHYYVLTLMSPFGHSRYMVVLAILIIR
jgi:hypothetical protein